MDRGMEPGITVRILGDFGPFSRMGKSIGYEVGVGGRTYLIDCGAPLFQQIGDEGLKEIDGLIITHCHDDHKRWFSDLALFNRYAPDGREKVPLLTSESVHQGLIESSMPALEKSLSVDAKRIVDIAYEDYVRFRILGPAAKYRIAALDEGGGRTALAVTDARGVRVGPERAKIVISPRTRRPRLLFRDPDCGEWVEPESFYSFSSRVFYEEEQNAFAGEGFTIEGVKAPVWHGLTGLAVRIRSGGETLVFSSDTAHDTGLWRELCTEKRPQKLGMTAAAFAAAAVIEGDINDYVERTWSEERYRQAVATFEGAAVIHDVSTRNSVVHTDYEKLHRTTLRRESTILTHSPDRMTSAWVLSNAGKVFRVRGSGFVELAAGRSYVMNADVYHKEEGKYYVGYRNDAGRYTVCERDGLLSLDLRCGPPDGVPVFRVDLYEDIHGRYFPRIDQPDAVYLRRTDGKVERTDFSAEGSRGRVVENQRDRLNPPA
jgi:glyoxylase-like metal-dependent hydrolase (beta-lactamase superfamily II)